MSDFSIITGILQANIVVQGILVFLIILSIGSWAIFFQKNASLKIVEFRNNSFEKKFWSGIMLEEFYNQIKKQKSKPINAEIFSSAMEEWILSDVINSVMAVEFVKVGIRERIIAATERTRIVTQKRLNKGLGFLTIVSSTSPFIGLLGTIVGIINSFIALSGTTSVTLNAIAPGIAEALFSTAIGLFVALPAVVFHTNLSTKINTANEAMEQFAVSIVNVLSRELDTFSVRNYKQANKIN